MKIVGIQGDLLILKTDQPLKGLKKREGKILVYGEVTGHAHQVIDGEVYEDGDRLFLQTTVPTSIIHEEHNPIPLEAPGTYEIVRQREYKSEDMTELVVD